MTHPIWNPVLVLATLLLLRCPDARALDHALLRPDDSDDFAVITARMVDPSLSPDEPTPTTSTSPASPTSTPSTTFTPSPTPPVPSPHRHALARAPAGRLRHVAHQVPAPQRQRHLHPTGDKHRVDFVTATRVALSRALYRPRARRVGAGENQAGSSPPPRCLARPAAQRQTGALLPAES